LQYTPLVPSPHSWDSFNRYRFSNYIHVYTVFILYSPSCALSLLPLHILVATPNPRQHLFWPPVLCFLSLCWVGVHCGIHKRSYSITNISYLNSPPSPFSFIFSSSKGNSLCSYLKPKCHFFLFYLESENRKVEQSCLGGLVPVGGGQRWGKGV
jgi:hypothetical protein